jgi:superfamily II DNA helicase RecQ
MATNKVPLLLLSATCRPIAVDSILRNLKLQPADVKMINGELTRPEIRLVRIPMEFTLKSADDLLRIFAPHTYTPAEQTVPTLIYSGSRNGTLQVMKVVNEARKTCLHEYEPEDKFIRRFHSCTEDDDKQLNMEDYMEGVFPVVSTTMALGLGQNLKLVRCVIHMGRGDPSAIVQMVGRCGRGGNSGIALLFMEKERKNGKNSVSLLL